MLNSFDQPSWVASVLDEVLASESVELCLVIKNVAQGFSTVNLPRNLVRKRRTLLYSAYTRLDRRMFSRGRDAFAPVSVDEKLRGVATLEVAPVRRKYSEYFPSEAVDVVRKHSLDIILRLGFGILRGEVLNVARHGIWSYHHGDPGKYRGGPPGYWEVMEANPVTGVILQRLTEQLDNGVVLDRAWFKTSPWSVTRNLSQFYWKAAPLVLRAIDRLAATGQAQSAACTSEYEPYQRRLYKIPTNWQVCKGVGSLALRYPAQKLRNSLFRYQWSLAYSFSKTFPDTFYNFKSLHPPRDRFWADPFPLCYQGRYYIFIEELLYSRNLGHLAVVPLDKDGSAGEPIKILEKPYHLSYPHVFFWNDELFLMPETGRNRSLDLYRCRVFPDQWDHYATLMSNVNVVDATLHEHEGRWWLFCGMARGREPTTNEELYLFSAETPLGPWHEHPTNPIKSDVRSSRPAGRLFKHNDQLYRPAQDLSLSPRFATAFNRVEVLTDTQYRETTTERLAGGWRQGQFGIHTINYSDGLAVVDVLVRRSRF